MTQGGVVTGLITYLKNFPITRVLMVVVALSIIAGCGCDDDEESNGDNNGGVVTPVEPEPEQDPEALQVINFRVTDDIENTAQLLKEKLVNEGRSWDFISLSNATSSDATTVSSIVEPNSRSFCDQYSAMCLIQNNQRVFFVPGSLASWSIYILLTDTDWNAVGITARLRTSSLTFPMLIYEGPVDNINSFDSFVITDFNRADVTPIVLGDPLEQDMEFLGGGLMYGYNEATMVLDFPSSSKGIWIGKESMYPGKAGSMIFTEYHQWGFDGVPVTYAKMRPSLWEYEREFDDDSLAAFDRPLLYSLDDSSAIYVVWNDFYDGTFMLVRGEPDTTGIHPGDINFDLANPLKLYSPNHPSSPVFSKLAPSITRFKGAWYMAWFDNNTGELQLASQDGGSSLRKQWDKQRSFASLSQFPPAMTATDDYLYVAWQVAGTRDIVVMHSIDGHNWIGPYPAGIRTSTGPALAYFKDKLYLSWTGDNQGHVLIQSSDNNGVTWSNKRKLLDTHSVAAPSLLPLPAKQRKRCGTNRDMLYLAYTDYTGYLSIKSSKNGVDWSDANRVLDSESKFSPSLVYHDCRFVLGWTDPTSASINLRGMSEKGSVDNELAIDSYR